MNWYHIAAGAEERLEFAKLAKASLVFREQNDEAAPYPHLILVYLRLENQHDSHVTWFCNDVAGLEAELLNSDGKPVQGPPSMASILSQYYLYRLPYRSRMDWFISSGGISMAGDLKSNAALMVGGRGWLLPRDGLSNYSLRVRVRGTPFASSNSIRKSELLFEVPATPVKIEK